MGIRCYHSVWSTNAPSQYGLQQPQMQRLVQKVHVPPTWSGMFWARTGYDLWSSSSKPACNQTGGCDGWLEPDGVIGLQPTTLVRVSQQPDKSKPSFYDDVCVVDGYHLCIWVNKTHVAELHHWGVLKECQWSMPRGVEGEEWTWSCGSMQECMPGFDLDVFCCRNKYGTQDKCRPSVYSMGSRDAWPTILVVLNAYDSPPPLVSCSPIYMRSPSALPNGMTILLFKL